jgi:hypothetical protein
VTQVADVVAAPAICVDVRRAAEMLGVSSWSVRAFIANGDLPVVKLPAVRGGESSRARVLILVEDLKRFAERHREAAS